MLALKIIIGIIVLLIAYPIRFYLVYKILVLINATELMWFLYWIYFPVTLTGAIIGLIAEKSIDQRVAEKVEAKKHA